MATTEQPTEPVQQQALPPRPRRALRRMLAPVALLTLTGITALAGTGLLHKAEATTNHDALADQPRMVTVVPAKVATWRGSRRYVGTLEPWQKAAVGPQVVSAYVLDVAVRPGDLVKQGDVLAHLDCRNRAASRQAIVMQQKALKAREHALARETERMRGMLEGKFVAPNEVDQKAAATETLLAQIAESEAVLERASLEVSDCTLRAPFDAEVAQRHVDAGTFVHPGQTMLTLIDRSTVRLTVSVPEADFAHVAPGTPVQVHCLALDRTSQATVSRRTPSADRGTRGVGVELDLANADRALPVGTTAELAVDVGQPVPALQVPLLAAQIRGEKATVLVVQDGVLHRKTWKLLGEREGSAFLAGDVPAGTQVVTEGKAGVHDGDRVQASVDKTSVAQAPAATGDASHPGAGR